MRAAFHSFLIFAFVPTYTGPSMPMYERMCRAKRGKQVRAKRDQKKKQQTSAGVGVLHKCLFTLRRTSRSTSLLRNTPPASSIIKEKLERCTTTPSPKRTTTFSPRAPSSPLGQREGQVDFSSNFRPSNSFLASSTLLPPVQYKTGLVHKYLTQFLPRHIQSV